MVDGSRSHLGCHSDGYPGRLLPSIYVGCCCCRSRTGSRQEMRQIRFLSKTYHFVPLACETLGPINNSGHLFITELGRCLSRLTGDTSETSHLYQRISITILRFNAIAFQGSFVPHDLAE